MKKINQIISLSLFSLFLLGCNTNHDFIGNWELIELQLGEDTITGKDIGNPNYEFKEDKTFTITVDNVTQDGTWEVNGDDLILTNNADIENKNELTIIEINDSIFHYTAGVGEQVSNVYLKKK